MTEVQKTATLTVSLQGDPVLLKAGNAPIAVQTLAPLWTSHPPPLSEELKDFLEYAEQTEDAFRVMVEAGLFTDEGAENDLVRKDAESIHASLLSCRRAARAGDLDTARRDLAQAEQTLHHALYRTKTWWWRQRHCHQSHLLLYYLLVLSVLVGAGTGFLDWALGFIGFQVADSIWSVPTAMFGLGVLGAVLRGLFYLQEKVSRRRHRRSFLTAHLAAPWIGGLFGIFTYLLLAAGVLALEGTATTPSVVERSPLTLALVFFAGFKWEWLLERLKRLWEGESGKIERSKERERGREREEPSGASGEAGAAMPPSIRPNQPTPAEAT